MAGWSWVKHPPSQCPPAAYLDHACALPVWDLELGQDPLDGVGFGLAWASISAGLGRLSRRFGLGKGWMGLQLGWLRWLIGAGLGGAQVGLGLGELAWGWLPVYLEH